MAVTFTPYADMVNLAGIHPARRINQVLIFGVITCDSSYPTGGESVTAAIVNTGLAAHTGEGGAAEITTLKRLIPLGRNYSAGAHFGLWDDTNNKLLVFVEDGTSGICAEVANTTNISTVAIPVIAVCDVA